MFSDRMRKPSWLSISPDGWSQTILEVKVLDVEVVDNGRQLWWTFLQPASCSLTRIMRHLWRRAVREKCRFESGPLLRAAESSRVLIRPSDQQLYATPVRWRDYLDGSLAKFDFGRVVNNIGKKKAFFVNLEVSGL